MKYVIIDDSIAGDHDDDGDNVPDEQEDEDGDGITNLGSLITLTYHYNNSL